MSDESRPDVENQPQHDSPKAPQSGSGTRITRREALLAAGGAVVVAAGATAVVTNQPASRREVAETPILTSDGPVGKGWTFVTRPDLTPPLMNQTDGPLPSTDDIVEAEGNVICLGPKDPAIHPSMQGNLLVTPAGEPIWVLPTRTGTFDVRVQQYKGRPVLTYWEGTSNTSGTGKGRGRLLDEHYETITTVTTGGDIGSEHSDIHETIITDAGTMFMFAYVEKPADLTHFGGPEKGWVLEGVIQEIDIATGKVLWEWHSLDHVPVTDSYLEFTPGEDGTHAKPYDYIHLNSVDPASKTLLVSARNTHTLYLIDRASGKVEWMFGGRRSSFTVPTQFAWQHDARRRPDGTITFFDNTSSPAIGPTSRGLRVRLDTDAMTATLVHEYLPPKPRLSFSQGNVQQLENGHLIIGWGQLPYVTEYSPDGTVVGGLNFAPGTSYRAYRAEWHATPKRPPDVVVRWLGTSATVFVSWNGATDVARWQVLSGDKPSTMGLLVDTAPTGFETSIAVSELDRYTEVRALDASGSVLGRRTLDFKNE